MQHERVRVRERKQKKISAGKESAVKRVDSMRTHTHAV